MLAANVSTKVWSVAHSPFFLSFHSCPSFPLSLSLLPDLYNPLSVLPGMIILSIFIKCPSSQLQLFGRVSHPLDNLLSVVPGEGDQRECEK